MCYPASNILFDQYSTNATKIPTRNYLKYYNVVYYFWGFTPSKLVTTGHSTYTPANSFSRESKKNWMHTTLQRHVRSSYY